MHGRARFKLTMSFYLPILLVSAAFLICGAIPSEIRTNLDNITESERWEQIEANVTKLVNACGAYGSEQETVVSAVKALLNANSALLNTVENASLSIRMLIDDAVFPSLDDNVYGSYQKLINYTKNEFVSRMLKVDSLATAFTSWIDEEHWNKMLGEPVQDIQSALEMLFNPMFGPLQRKQGENMLKITCQKLDPASALGHLWKHLGEGCPRTKGPRAELDVKVVAPNVKELPCAPEAIMISNNYTTTAALELVQFFGGIVGNLGFVLGACLNVGFEASAKSEAFRFAVSVNEVSDYLAKYLFDLENTYFPHFALGLLDTAVDNVTTPDELPDAISRAVKSLDESYTDFKHTIIAFTNGTLKNHVGYTSSNSTLPGCASAQYERTTYVDVNLFHNYRERDYVINRAPSDKECQNEMWKRYQTWMTKLEKEHNMTLADLWNSEIEKPDCERFCDEKNGLFLDLLKQLARKWNTDDNGFRNIFVGCYDKSEIGSLPPPTNETVPLIDGYAADCDSHKMVLYFVM